VDEGVINAGERHQLVFRVFWRSLVMDERERSFSEVCEGAAKMLQALAEQSAGCEAPVLFDCDAYQPCLKALSDVLAEFARVKLTD